MTLITYGTEDGKSLQLENGFDFDITTESGLFILQENESRLLLESTEGFVSAADL